MSTSFPFLKQGALIAKLAPFDMEARPPRVPYLVKDPSLLAPYFKRWFWQPVLKHVPDSMAANTLTILSNVCSTLAFLLILLFDRLHGTPAVLLWLVAAADFVYLTLDNIDGSHARRTNSSSPLGEFLDHWLDSFNLGFMVLSMMMIIHVPAWLALPLVSFAMLAYFAQMWEQLVTGWLLMDRMGTIEAMMVVIALLLPLGVTGTHWIGQPVAAGWPSYGMFTALVVAVGYAFTPAGSVLRVRRQLGHFLPFLLVQAGLLVWCHLVALPLLAAGMMITLVNAFLIGRVLIARVTISPFRGWDPILLAGLAVPVAGALFLRWPFELHVKLALALTIYACFRLLTDFWALLVSMQDYLREGEFLEVLLRVTGRRRAQLAPFDEEAEESPRHV